LSSLNKIILIGTVTYEPDRRVTTNGSPILKFTLKVDRPNRNEATGPSGFDLIHIIAWSPLADTVKKFNKNSLVLVEGRINNRSFETNEGKRKWVTEIDAKNIRVISNSSENNDADTLGQNTASVSNSLEEKPLDQFDVNNFDFGGDITNNDTKDQINSPEEVDETIPF
jgi:single-strand DNA-binding protein